MKLHIKRLSPAKSQELIDNWNATVPVGYLVDVLMDDGTTRQVETESEAWLMGGHSAMVMLKGISGAFSLQRCEAH